jgi:hypothetical protein
MREELDGDFAAAVSSTLTEWTSDADEEAWRDLEGDDAADSTSS